MEFVLEAPEELGEEVASIVEKYMKKAGEVFCKTVKLNAEAVISQHWEH